MTTEQPPEMELLERLRLAPPKLSVSKAASRADLSEGRWRQLAKGYQQANPQTRLPTKAPADTLARMAEAVGATPEQLEEVGRGDAAAVMRDARANLGRGLEKIIPTGPSEDYPLEADNDPAAILEELVSQGWETARALTAAVAASSPSEGLLSAAREAVHFIDAYLIIRILTSGHAAEMEGWLARIYREREVFYRELSTGEPRFPWLTAEEIEEQEKEHDLETKTEPAASAEAGEAQEASAGPAGSVDHSEIWPPRHPGWTSEPPTVGDDEDRRQGDQL